MFSKKKFLIITCNLSFTIFILYLLESIKTGFNLPGCIVMTANLIYIPGVMIFKKKFFPVWSIIYCGALIYTAAVLPGVINSNFTPLFVLIVLMIAKPNWKYRLIILYAAGIAITFILINETALHFLQHVTRTCWIFYIVNFVIDQKYERKELDLTADEVLILEELNEKKLLKACTSFSKNTITQKLKNARERNKIPTNAELLAEYNLTKK